MTKKIQRVLAVGAHPDDIELGCAGTLAKITKEGGKAICVYLSRGEKSGNPETRSNESVAALSKLGVKDVVFGDFPDTNIPHTHDCIQFLEDYCTEFKPDLVLTHSINDAHQDHRTVGWLSHSAFRNCKKILAYESPRVTHDFKPQFFVDISEMIETKWNCLKTHSSQKTKRYLSYESMVNLAYFRGSQVGVKAAEAFEIIHYLENSF